MSDFYSNVLITAKYFSQEFVFSLTNSENLFFDLTQRIQEKFSLSKFSLQYSDDDGDICRITNQIEIDEAVRISAANNLTVEILDSENFDFPPASPTRKISSEDFSVPDLEDYSSDEEYLYQDARNARPLNQQQAQQTQNQKEEKILSIISVNEEKNRSENVSENEMKIQHQTLRTEISIEQTPDDRAQTEEVTEEKEEKKNSNYFDDETREEIGSEIVSQREESAVYPSLQNFYGLSRESSAEISVNSQPSNAPISRTSAAFANNLAAFFSSPSVLSIINTNMESLLPHMNDLPLFVYQICLFDNSLFSHPLVMFVFSRAQLHANYSCSSCHRNPIIGIRFHCENCHQSLCDDCVPHHEQNHLILRNSVADYNFDESNIPRPASPKSARKNFASRVAHGLSKVDSAFGGFVEDVKKLIHEAFVAMEEKQENLKSTFKTKNSPELPRPA